jgi:GT2 family glycosyltransferase
MILTGLAVCETRLRIVQEPVQGLSAARNGGILAARGEFIALLDADDLWDPGYLQAHLDNLETNDADISYSRLRFVDVAGRPTGKETRPPMTGVGARELLRSNPCTAMIVVRRPVFDTAGLFDETLRRVEDQEWLFRAAASGATLRGVDRVLASYRITPGGLSANLDAMLESHAVMLQRAGQVAPGLVDRFSRLSQAAMLRYCARRAMEHGLGAEVAKGYLHRMWRLAPDLAVREPMATASACASVMLPGLAQRLRGGTTGSPGGAA